MAAPYWKRTNFDPAPVGKTIRINERPFTVVGITPQGFTGTMTLFGPELFFPLGVFHTLGNGFQGENACTLARPDAYNLFLAARLKDVVSMAAALAGAGPLRSEPGGHVTGRPHGSRAGLDGPAALQDVYLSHRRTRASPRSPSSCSA